MQYKINQQFSKILFGIEEETILENKNGAVYLNGNQVSSKVWTATGKALKYLTAGSIGNRLRGFFILNGKQYKQFDSILNEIEKNLYEVRSA